MIFPENPEKNEFYNDVYYGPYHYQIRVSVPRLMLKQHYGWRECIFDYENLKEAPWLDSIEPDFEQFGFVQLRKVDDIRKCSIACKMMQRLTRAYQLMKMEEGNKELVYLIQLYIDTFLQLSLYMIEANIYDDETILDKTKNACNLSISAYDQYGPKDDNVFYEGTLPSMEEILDEGGYWYDHRNKERNLITALRHLIMVKVQTKKCLVRNYDSIFWEYALDFPEIVELFRRIAIVSFLGNYQHTRERPAFLQRLVYLSMLSKERMDDDMFIRWCSEREHVIFLLAKEFFSVQLRYQFSLERFLEHYNKWSEAKTISLRAAETLREMLNTNRIGFDEIEAQLEAIHRETLPLITKLHKGLFYEHALRSMSTLVERFTEPLSQEPIRSENFIDASQKRLIALIAEYIVKNLWFGNRPKHVYGETNRLPLEYLKPMGITKKSIKIMRDLVRKYECNELADNAIPRYLTDIYQHSVKDFHRIRYYLLKLEEFSSVVEFRMSDRQTANQIRAWRARMYIPPMEPLPDGVGIIRYCPNCLQWAWPVVDLNNVEATWNNCYSWGADRIIMDLDDHKFYCDKQNTSVTSRKSVETVIEMERKEPGSVKDLTPVIAKMIRRYKATKDCSEVELIPVQMFGTIKLLGDALWALCEDCGSLAKFDKQHLDHRGFNCRAHDHPDFIRRENDLLKKKRLTVTTTTTTVPLPTKPKVSNICELCLKEPKQKLVKLKVWNNLKFPVETFFQDINICQDCKKGSKTDEGEILVLSVLQEDIARRRVKRELGQIY